MEEKQRTVEALHPPVGRNVLQVSLQHARLLAALWHAWVERALDIVDLALIARREEVQRERAERDDARPGSIGLRASPVAGERLVVDLKAAERSAPWKGIEKKGRKEAHRGT